MSLFCNYTRDFKKDGYIYTRKYLVWIQKKLYKNIVQYKKSLVFIQLRT